jgi:hypothetical protein
MSRLVQVLFKHFLRVLIDLREFRGFHSFFIDYFTALLLVWGVPFSTNELYKITLPEVSS